MSYFSIVTFGAPSYGRIRSFYRSEATAIADACELGGGSLTSVRVVECDTARAAKRADISTARNVVWSR